MDMGDLDAASSRVCVHYRPVIFSRNYVRNTTELLHETQVPITDLFHVKQDPLLKYNLAPVLSPLHKLRSSGVMETMLFSIKAPCFTLKTKQN